MKLQKNNDLLSFYNEEEIKEILNNDTKLVYVDTGMEEFVARYEDLPDVIVDIDNKFGHSVNLKIYDFDYPDMNNPLLTTNGCFLDKCQPEVRKDIIKRLIGLQIGEEEIKDYKVINEDALDEINRLLDENDELEK